MNKISRIFSLRAFFSVLFGFVVFLFFLRYYQFHLHYEEQLQLFLFTSDYWSQLISKPGGLADYIGTFFTQFYYVERLGALIIALLLVLLQSQVHSLTKKISKNESFFPLTFIPSILIFALLCNENFLLSGLIALMLTLAAVRIYTLIKNPVVRIIGAIIVAPVLFWFAGGVFWICSLLCLILEWSYFKQLSKLQWTILILGLLVTALSPVVFKHLFVLQYPLSRLWWGLCYSRYPVVSPYPLLVAWLSVPLLVVAFRFLPVFKKQSVNIAVLLSLSLIVSIFAAYFIRKSADFKKEEIMAYDYYARTQNWDKIIALANHKDPDSPLSVACLNLALSKTGKLGDSMFRYFQNGPEGLLPTFQRDFTSPFISGEIYYHLGFLNTSMRYNFEAMEAIPDYKKSARAVKRMAEVNLLNGEYKVAAKYLSYLQSTLFYRSWADETMKCIDNPRLIEQNKEWSALKKYRLTEDFLFSEQDKDQMLGILFSHATTNKMAYEYLMAYTLLTKDIEHFVKYFPLGKSLDYQEIPSHFQEALILFWSTQSANFDQTPWPITDPVKQYLVSYAKAYNTNGRENADPRSMADFSQTYWYYYHFRK